MTRSGIWTTPPRQEPAKHLWQPDAATYLKELCKGTAGNHSPLPEKTVETAIAELQDPTDVIDQEIHDSEELAEEEDPERDALQERAAEVTIDSACATPADPQVRNAGSTLSAPPMPN